MITKQDLIRQHKADLGSYPTDGALGYLEWLEDKYLELVNKKQEVSFADLEGLES